MTRTATKTATESTTTSSAASFDEHLHGLAQQIAGAWASVPEVVAAEDALRRTEQGAARFREALTVRDDTIATAVADGVQQLADDAESVDRVRQQVIDAASLQLAGQAIGVSVTQAITGAQHGVTQARIANADRVLHTLHTVLGEVITLTRATLGDLAGIDTAEAAISAGGAAVDAWARLQRLRDLHRTLRTAQRAVWVDLTPGTAALNPLHFTDRAWTLDVPGYGEDDGLALLRFLARSDVLAWVPTQAQVKHADSRLRAYAKDEAHREQNEIHALQGRQVNERELRTHLDIADYEAAAEAPRPMRHGAELSRH